MKLTQRQLGKISGIISEEATMRNNLHESMYENRKQSRINEVFLSEPELPFDAVPDYLRMRIEDDYSQTNPLFSEIVTKFNKVVYSLRVEVAGTPNDAMDFVAFAEQKLRKVRPILAGDPKD